MNKKVKILIPLLLAIALVAATAIVLFLYLKKDGTKSVKITAQEAITTFDIQNVENSFTKLDFYILQPTPHGQAAEEAVKYIQDSDDGKRFAAIYLLSHAGDQNNKADLAKALDDQNQAYVTLAAGTLIGWGDKNAIPVLIESLTSKEAIPFSDPPSPLAQLASKALPYYTGKDFGLSATTTEEELNNAQAEWKMWWSSNNENIQWDDEAKKYLTK